MVDDTRDSLPDQGRHGSKDPAHPDRDETRCLILSAAREHFLHAGYRGTSTRQVADDCGITQPALYHHFGGKEELYVAVLENELQQIERRLRDAEEGSSSSTAALEALADSLIQHTDFKRSLVIHDMRAELSEAMRDHVSANFAQAFHHPLGRVMERCIDEGVVRRPEEVGLTHLELIRYFLHVTGFFVGRDKDRKSQHSGATVVTLFLGGFGTQSAPHT